MSTNPLQEIATRIKELRQICEYSQKFVSEKLGVDEATYLEYESGTVDIPVGFLYNLASLYKVELTTILTGKEPKLHAYSLVKADEGLSIDRRQPYKYLSLAHKFSDKKAEPFMVTVDPSDDEMSLSSHSGQEICYVVEGSLALKVDGHDLVVETGDLLYFDSSKPHGMKALSGKQAKFLAIIIA